MRDHAACVQDVGFGYAYHTIGLECQGKEGDQTKEAIIYETKTTKEVVSSLIVSRERRHARRNSPVVSQSFA